jgi:hypothetical protein
MDLKELNKRWNCLSVDDQNLLIFLSIINLIILDFTMGIYFSGDLAFSLMVLEIFSFSALKAYYLLRKPNDS